MTRILCLGDTQLGVGTVDLADQATILDRIADLAILEDVDLVLHGGDVFEGPVITPEQLRVFADFVARLHTAEIPVIAVSGNGRHDLAVRETNGLAIFARIPGITIASRPWVHAAAGVAVACLPWVHPGRLIAARNGGDRDAIHADMVDALLRIARGLRTEIASDHPGVPAVLLAHWAVTGASLPTGLPADQLREPVLPLSELEQLGYDAIVLSHIHKPQLLSTGPLTVDRNGSHVVEQPTRIFYTGPPQPQNFGDRCDTYGVWLLDTAADTLVFEPVESRRFVTLDVDLVALPFDDVPIHCVYTRYQEGVDVGGAIVRVRYRATAEQARRIGNAQLRQELLDAGAHTVRVDPDIVREQRARVTVDDVEQLGELDWLDQWITASDIGDEVVIEGMRTRTARYLEGAR